WDSGWRGTNSGAGHAATRKPAALVKRRGGRGWTAAPTPRRAGSGAVVAKRGYLRGGIWMASQLAIANDIAPGVAEERDQILAGLAGGQKRFGPKDLSDPCGSELFDRICRLPEYYPTSTERGLMRRYGDDIAALVGPRAAIIELGAGSSMKVRLLLDHLV